MIILIFHERISFANRSIGYRRNQQKWSNPRLTNMALKVDAVVSGKLADRWMTLSLYATSTSVYGAYEFCTSQFWNFVKSPLHVSFTLRLVEYSDRARIRIRGQRWM
jgi:hypothetical protein